MSDPIVEILLRTDWYDPSLNENQDLRDQGLDSLGLALLLSDLERQFKIRIPLDALTVDSWSTVQKIRDQIETMRSAQKNS